MKKTTPAKQDDPRKPRTSGLANNKPTFDVGGQAPTISDLLGSLIKKRRFD